MQFLFAVGDSEILLPLFSGLGAGELESGVNIKVSQIEILPQARDLIRTVDTRGVVVIHHSCRGLIKSAQFLSK